MKRKRNTSSTEVSSGKTSSSDIENNGMRISLHEQSEGKKRKLERGVGNESDIAVRLQNADILSKYRNKNQHIKIESVKTVSDIAINEINEDDEIWICGIPHSVDVNELIGKSVKLGNKKCSFQTKEVQLESVSSKYLDEKGVYKNTLSMIFQKNNSELSIKNVKLQGEITIQKKIVYSDIPSIELAVSGVNEGTIFPDSIVPRHPLFGKNFEDKININTKIMKMLCAADTEVQSDMNNIRIKQETDESRVKPKVTDKSSNTANSVKKSKNEKKGNNDEDLARIKLIFENS